MERKRVKNVIVMILATVWVCAGLPLISPAGEGPAKKEKEKVPAETTQAKKATLTIAPASGTKAGIDLTNTVPVRGMQFTISGVKLTEVRATSRTAGFLVKFNEENGKVMIVSVSEDEIAPGTGGIAELIYQEAKGAKVSVSEIKIVGSNREEL